MNRFWLFLAFLGTLVFSFSFTSTADARGRGPRIIFYGWGDEYSELQHDIETPDGSKWDLSVKYGQFSLFWIPIWNWSPEYVLTKNETYLALEPEESDDEETLALKKEFLDSLKKKYDLPDQASVPLLTSIGGKPIILAIIAFFIWAQFRKEDEPTVVAEGAEGAEGADGQPGAEGQSGAEGKEQIDFMAQNDSQTNDQSNGENKL